MPVRWNTRTTTNPFPIHINILIIEVNIAKRKTVIYWQKIVE